MNNTNKKFKLLYITNDVKKALIAEEAEVARIFLDLETLGKKERQFGKNTFISTHSLEDAKAIARCLTKSELVVRINPINSNSENEIESVIKVSPDYIMLPMFKTSEEVEVFIKLINGRTKTILLIERIEAVSCLDKILELPGVEEFHIGLNDLALSMKLNFMFELFPNGIVEEIVKKIQKKGFPVGIGGMSRIGTGELPAELILSEHCRLDSSGVILSRGFLEGTDELSDEQMQLFFTENVKKIFETYVDLEKKSEEEMLENKEKLANIVKKISNRIKST